MKKLLTGLFITVLFSMNNVYANSGPWRNEPAPGFNAVPLKSSSVEVLKEELIFDASEVELPSKALVTAKYFLRNTSEKAESYSIAFPYIGGNLNNWGPEEQPFKAKVLLDGVKLEAEVKLIPDLMFRESDGGSLKGIESLRTYKSGLTFEEILKHMRGAVDASDFDISKYPRVPPRGEADNWLQKSQIIELILFELDLKPGRTHELEIFYYQPGGRDRQKTKDYTYIYYYFLEPAKYWKSFKDLSVTIKLPDGYCITESSLPFQREKESGIYRGYFSVLPEVNLEFKTYKALNPFQKLLEELSKAGWIILYVVYLFPLIAAASVIAAIVLLCRNFRKREK